MTTALLRTGRPIDLLDPEMFDDPFPIYEQLRVRRADPLEVIVQMIGVSGEDAEHIRASLRHVLDTHGPAEVTNALLARRPELASNPEPLPADALAARAP